MSNKAFKEYTTSIAFRLEISKPQVDVLCQLDQGFQYSDYSHFITTKRALKKKGLIISKRIWPSRVFNGKEVIEYVDRLTKAGKLTVGLIKEAGLYQEYESLDNRIKGWCKKVS